MTSVESRRINTASLAGRTDAGVPPNPLLSATMSLQIELAEARLLPSRCFNRVQEESSLIGECVRRCLLKAVRKWLDGCT